MNASVTPCPYAHLSNALPLNSGPLSSVIELGLPRKSNTLTTRSPGNDKSASQARHSRLKSSTTLKMRNLVPVAS